MYAIEIILELGTRVVIEKIEKDNDNPLLTHITVKADNVNELLLAKEVDSFTGRCAYSEERHPISPPEIKGIIPVSVGTYDEDKTINGINDILKTEYKPIKTCLSKIMKEARNKMLGSLGDLIDDFSFSDTNVVSFYQLTQEDSCAIYASTFLYKEKINGNIKVCPTDKINDSLCKQDNFTDAKVYFLMRLLKGLRKIQSCASNDSTFYVCIPSKWTPTEGEEYIIPGFSIGYTDKDEATKVVRSPSNDYGSVIEFSGVGPKMYEISQLSNELKDFKVIIEPNFRFKVTSVANKEIISVEPTDTQDESKLAKAFSEQLEEFKKKIPLRPGWIESIDDDTGDVYYMEEETSLTQWEKPEIEDPSFYSGSSIKKGLSSSLKIGKSKNKILTKPGIAINPNKSGLRSNNSKAGIIFASPPGFPTSDESFNCQKERALNGSQSGVDQEFLMDYSSNGMITSNDTANDCGSLSETPLINYDIEINVNINGSSCEIPLPDDCNNEVLMSSSSLSSQQAEVPLEYPNNIQDEQPLPPPGYSSGASEEVPLLPEQPNDFLSEEPIQISRFQNSYQNNEEPLPPSFNSSSGISDEVPLQPNGPSISPTKNTSQWRRSTYNKSPPKHPGIMNSQLSSSQTNNFPLAIPPPLPFPSSSSSPSPPSNTSPPSNNNPLLAIPPPLPFSTTTTTTAPTAMPTPPTTTSPSFTFPSTTPPSSPRGQGNNNWRTSKKLEARKSCTKGDFLKVQQRTTQMNDPFQQTSNPQQVYRNFNGNPNGSPLSFSRF